MQEFLLLTKIKMLKTSFVYIYTLYVLVYKYIHNLTIVKK